MSTNEVLLKFKKVEPFVAPIISSIEVKKINSGSAKCTITFNLRDQHGAISFSEGMDATDRLQRVFQTLTGLEVSFNRPSDDAVSHASFTMPSTNMSIMTDIKRLFDGHRKAGLYTLRR